MSILAFVLLLLSSPGDLPAGSLSLAAPAIHAPLVYSAYDTESDPPSHEYGLPDRDDEREGEEEDGNGKAPRALLNNPLLDPTIAAGTRLDLVNRPVPGHGTSSRSPFLRC